MKEMRSLEAQEEGSGGIYDADGSMLGADRDNKKEIGGHVDEGEELKTSSSSTQHVEDYYESSLKEDGMIGLNGNEKVYDNEEEDIMGSVSVDAEVRISAIFF